MFTKVVLIKRIVVVAALIPVISITKSTYVVVESRVTLLEYAITVPNLSSGESTFGSIESLEVRLGELEVKAIGKNTTEVLKNLMKNAVGLEIVPSEERYYPSTRVRDESTLKKPDNFSYTLF